MYRNHFQNVGFGISELWWRRTGCQGDGTELTAWNSRWLSWECPKHPNETCKPVQTSLCFEYIACICLPRLGQLVEWLGGGEAHFVFVLTDRRDHGNIFARPPASFASMRFTRPNEGFLFVKRCQEWQFVLRLETKTASIIWPGKESCARQEWQGQVDVLKYSLQHHWQHDHFRRAPRQGFTWTAYSSPAQRRGFQFFYVSYFFLFASFFTSDHWDWTCEGSGTLRVCHCSNWGDASIWFTIL